MDAVTKRIVLKSAFLFLMLTVSVAGIHRIMMRTADLPVARKTSAKRTPVIVWMPGMENQLKLSRIQQSIAPRGEGNRTTI